MTVVKTCAIPICGALRIFSLRWCARPLSSSSPPPPPPIAFDAVRRAFLFISFLFLTPRTPLHSQVVGARGGGGRRRRRHACWPLLLSVRRAPPPLGALVPSPAPPSPPSPRRFPTLSSFPASAACSPLLVFSPSITTRRAGHHHAVRRRGRGPGKAHTCWACLAATLGCYSSRWAPSFFLWALRTPSAPGRRVVWAAWSSTCCPHVGSPRARRSGFPACLLFSALLSEGKLRTLNFSALLSHRKLGIPPRTIFTRAHSLVALAPSL